MKRMYSLEDLLTGSAAETVDTPSLVPEETHGVVNAQQNQRSIRRAALAIDNISVAQAAADDLEDIQQTVAEVSADGRIGLESYVMAQLAIQANPVLRDFQLANFGPSLEDFDGTGDVTVSLEGVGDMIKSVLAGVGKLVVRWSEELNRALAFTATRTLMAQRGLRKVQEWASRHRGSPAAAGPITIDGDVLLVDGAPPKAPVRALVDLANTMDYMVSRFQPETINALRSNARSIGLINEATPETFRKTFDATVRGWKTAGVNPQQVNDSLLGGYRLFDDLKSTYHGNDANLAKLDALATRGQMRTYAYMGADGVGSELGRQEFKALAPDEVYTVATAHLKTLAKVKKMESAVQSLLSAYRSGLVALAPGLSGAGLFVAIYTNSLFLMIRALPLAAYPGGNAHKEEVRYLRRALRAQERSVRYATFDSVQLELLYVRHVLRYCRTSMKAAGYR